MKRIFFMGSTLLDGINPPQGDITVVIQGNRITAVGRGANVPAPETQDEVYDISGKTLMPGLFQCHMHAAMDNLRSYQELDMKYPANYLTLVAARNAERLVRKGFTSAIGAGSPANIDVVLKHAIVAGLIVGPRFYPCGRHLVTTGESLDYMPRFWKSGIDSGFGLVCDGPEEFRKAVRGEIKDGAEIVKVHVSGGHGSNIPLQHMAITFKELKAACETAHERGKKLRAHAASKEGILLSVRAGADLVDHVDFFDDECIEAFLKNGTSIAASVLNLTRSIKAAEGRSTTESHTSFATGMSSPFFNSIILDKGEMARALDNMRTFLPRALTAGVNIINGDDFGGASSPHGTYAEELVAYVQEVGISARDVITWATRNSARFIGDADLGVVSVGKIADLLVVDGAPAEDITVLRHQSNLLVIMKDGAFVECKLEARR